MATPFLSVMGYQISLYTQTLFHQKNEHNNLLSSNLKADASWDIRLTCNTISKSIIIHKNI